MHARLKSTVFSSRLKALWLVISWSDVGSEFHAAGPANAKLRSPYLRRVAGCSCMSSTARRTEQGTRCDTGDRRDYSSDIYDRLHPV